MKSARSTVDYAVVLLRVLLGGLFIAHLWWKFVLREGGIEGWWQGLLQNGYPSYVPANVFSAEVLGALLLIPGICTRYVALYAVPMMVGATQFWLVRKGFFFIYAGAELPLVWTVLLVLQVMLGDGPYALARSPDPWEVWRRLVAGRGAG